MKFSVTAPDRSSMGFNTYCCAGRHWPGGNPVIVEVVDQDECPRVPHPTRTDVKMLDPVRIGRIAWKEIQEDPLLSKNAAPEDAELTLPPSNPTELLKEENRKLRDRLVGLEVRLKALESASQAPANDGTSERIEALEAALAKLSVPAVVPVVAPAEDSADSSVLDSEKATPPAAPLPAAIDPPPAAPAQSRGRRGKGG